MKKSEYQFAIFYKGYIILYYIIFILYYYIYFWLHYNDLLIWNAINIA